MKNKAPTEDENVVEWSPKQVDYVDSMNVSTIQAK